MLTFSMDSARRSDEGNQTDIKKRDYILLSYSCPVVTSHSSPCLVFPHESLSVTYLLLWFLMHLRPSTLTPLIPSCRGAQEDLLFSLSSSQYILFFPFVPLDTAVSNLSPPTSVYLACRLKISPCHLCFPGHQQKCG